ILTASGTDRTAILWDAASGLQLRTFRVDGSILTSASFSPDGTRIAASCYQDKVVRLLDTVTGQPIASFEAPGSQPGIGESPAIVFSPDGKHLFTAATASNSAPGGVVR